MALARGEFRARPADARARRARADAQRGDRDRGLARARHPDDARSDRRRRRGRARGRAPAARASSDGVEIVAGRRPQPAGRARAGRVAGRHAGDRPHARGVRGARATRMSAGVVAALAPRIDALVPRRDRRCADRAAADVEAFAAAPCRHRGRRRRAPRDGRSGARRRAGTRRRRAIGCSCSVRSTPWPMQCVRWVQKAAMGEGYNCRRQRRPSPRSKPTDGTRTETAPRRRGRAGRAGRDLPSHADPGPRARKRRGRCPAGCPGAHRRANSKPATCRWWRPKARRPKARSGMDERAADARDPRARATRQRPRIAGDGRSRARCSDGDRRDHAIASRSRTRLQAPRRDLPRAHRRRQLRRELRQLLHRGRRPTSSSPRCAPPQLAGYRESATRRRQDRAARARRPVRHARRRPKTRACAPRNVTRRRRRRASSRSMPNVAAATPPSRSPPPPSPSRSPPRRAPSPRSPRSSPPCRPLPAPASPSSSPRSASRPTPTPCATSCAPPVSALSPKRCPPTRAPSPAFGWARC